MMRYFLLLHKASTEDEVYRIHAKNYLINNEKHYSNGGKKQIYGSDWLIDEAIYFNDNEMQRMLLEQVRDQYISLKEGRMTSNRKKRLSGSALNWRRFRMGKNMRYYKYWKQEK